MERRLDGIFAGIVWAFLSFYYLRFVRRGRRDMPLLRYMLLSLLGFLILCAGLGLLISLTR